MTSQANRRRQTRRAAKKAAARRAAEDQQPTLPDIDPVTAGWRWSRKPPKGSLSYQIAEEADRWEAFWREHVVEPKMPTSVARHSTAVAQAVAVECGRLGWNRVPSTITVHVVLRGLGRLSGIPKVQPGRIPTSPSSEAAPPPREPASPPPANGSSALAEALVSSAIDTLRKKEVPLPVRIEAAIENLAQAEKAV